MDAQKSLDFGSGLVPQLALSRVTDPATSSAAAHAVESSGVAGAQREACLSVVRESPGMTAAEIAERAGMERHAPSRRLPELRRAGLVRNGAARVCRVTGNASLTWEAT